MQDPDDERNNFAPERQLQVEGDDSIGRPRIKTAIGLHDSNSTVTLYDEDGEHIGVMSISAALGVARERRLRLFIVQPDSCPLVAQVLKLRRETYAIRIFPSTERLSTATSNNTLVLHINLDGFQDVQSVEELAELLYILLVNHFGADATKFISADKGAQLAEEIWTRGLNR